MAKLNLKLNLKFVIAGLLASSAFISMGLSQDREVLEFHGIQPGVSKVSDLKPPVFKSRLSEKTSPKVGLRIIDYRIDPWEKVSVFAMDELIVGVDLYPAKPYSPAAIGKAFSLGTLKKIQQLPAIANFPHDKSAGNFLFSDSAWALLEIDQNDDGDSVKRVRLFRSPRYYASSDSSKTSDQSKKLTSKNRSTFPPPPPIPSGSVRPSSKTSSTKKGSDQLLKNQPAAEKPTTDPTFHQRDTMELHGVIPGKTTRKELEQLSKWKQAQLSDPLSRLDVFEYYNVQPSDQELAFQIRLSQLHELDRNLALAPQQKKELQMERAAIGFDEVEILSYRLDDWKKVVLLTHGDIVWAIDAFPPDGATLDQIESVFNLTGNLQKVFEQPDEDPYFEKHFPPIRSKFGDGPELVTGSEEAPNLYSIQKRELHRYFRPQGLRVGPILVPSALQYREYSNKRIATFSLRQNAVDDPEGNQAEVKVIRFFADVPLRYPLFGVTLNEVPAPRQHAELAGRKMISEVVKVTPSAEKMGFQTGDYIFEINGLKIDSMKEFQTAAYGCPLNRESQVKVWRGDHAVILKATPSRAPLGFAYDWRANEYFNKNLLNESLRDLEIAQTLEPENALFTFHLGYHSFATGKLKRALDLFERSTQLDGEYSNAYFHHGLTSLKLGKTEQAIKSFDKAISLNPDNAAYRIERGRLFRVTKEWKLAIKDFDHLIKKRPEQYQGYAERGLTYHQMQDTKKAVADFTRALEINPQLGLAIVKRAQIWMGTGDEEKAMQEFDRAIQLYPKYATAYSYRGLLHLKQEDFGKARRDFSQAIANNPKDYLALYNRGVANFREGNFQDAIDDFSNVILKNPNYALAWQARAAAFSKIGETEKADADRSKAKELKDQQN